jgi:hypothetical protein
MCLYVRSNDLGLGTPFNLAEGAALMHLVGRLTATRRAGSPTSSAMPTFTRTTWKWCGTAHPYALPAPQLRISDRVPDFAVTGKYQPEWLELEPSDFALEGYQHHAPITGAYGGMTRLDFIPGTLCDARMWSRTATTGRAVRLPPCATVRGQHAPANACTD